MSTIAVETHSPHSIGTWTLRDGVRNCSGYQLAFPWHGQAFYIIFCPVLRTNCGAQAVNCRAVVPTQAVKEILLAGDANRLVAELTFAAWIARLATKIDLVVTVACTT